MTLINTENCQGFLLGNKKALFFGIPYWLEFVAFKLYNISLKTPISGHFRPLFSFVINQQSLFPKELVPPRTNKKKQKNTNTPITPYKPHQQVLLVFNINI